MATTGRKIALSLLCELTLIWLLLGLVLAYGSEPAKLELKVTPRVCQAPCTVRADIRIEPNALNRWFAVELDGPMFRSSAYELEGADAPIRYTFSFKDIPEGSYYIVVVLYRGGSRSEVARVKQEIEVN